MPWIPKVRTGEDSGSASSKAPAKASSRDSGKDARKNSAEHSETAEKTSSTEDTKRQAAAQKDELCEVSTARRWVCKVRTGEDSGSASSKAPAKASSRDSGKGVGKDAGTNSAEHSKSAAKANSMEGSKRQAAVQRGEHCEVTKHTSMGCAIVTMQEVGVRQAILRIGSELSIADVRVNLKPHFAKETGEEVTTDLFVAWGRQVEKGTPLSEADLVSFFDQKHRELVAGGCLQEPVQRAPTLGAPMRDAAARQMPTGASVGVPMGALMGAPMGAPVGMPVAPMGAPLGMPMPPRMPAPVQGPLPKQQMVQWQQQAMMQAVAQRQWAAQMQAHSMMMYQQQQQQQQQQQAMASAAMNTRQREEDSEAKRKQLQRDHEQTVSGLRRERDRATQEFVAAQAENARLREEMREVQARVEALEAATEATLSEHCDREVEAWRQGQSAPTAYQQPHLVRVTKKALKELAPRSHAQDCARIRGARVTAVRRVTNTHLWSQYQAQRKQIAERIRRRPECPSVAELASGCAKVQELFPHIRLDKDANEVLLLHGCPTESIPYIVEHGFDERLSKRGGALYGNGVYFTFESCKAAQYSGPGLEGTLILARVILGHPFQAEGPLSHLPMLEEYNTPYDSTIVRPGISKGKGKGGLRQKHWEFVVQRGCLQA